jgi:hypothetical protein
MTRLRIAIRSIFRYLDKKWPHILLAVCEKKQFESFTLYALEDEEDFFNSVVETLSILKQYDPIRYSRVKKYLPRIAYAKQGSDCYRPEVEAFFVDTFPLDDICFFASILVHEATHGFIYKKGIPYDHTRERQENICYQEQFKFIVRVIELETAMTFAEKEQRIKAWKEWFEIQKKEAHKGNWALEGRLKRLKEFSGSNLFVRFVRKTFVWFNKD